MTTKCIQEQYAPHCVCFGCGAANPKGLHLRSFPEKDRLVADWTPKPEHHAFPGVLNGGIIGTLLDCHSNWTASWSLMKERGDDDMPCTVTAEYTVHLLRPTPTDGSVHLEGKAVDIQGNRVTVEARLSAGGKTCATCRGVFVAVEPGHPGYWKDSG